MNRTFTFLNKVQQGEYDFKYIALDLETTGLNPRKDSIVGASFCVKEGIGYYTTDIRGIIDVINNNKIIPIFHNAVFDYSFLKQNGFIINSKLLHDTMLLADLLNPDRPTLKLKPLAVEQLGEGADNSDKAMTKWLDENGLGREAIHRAPKDILTNYAAEDAVNTYELFKKLCKSISGIRDYLLRHNITGDPWKYYTTEILPLIPVVVDMQLNGVKLDLEATATKQKELEDRMKILNNELNLVNKNIITKAEDLLHERKIAFRKKQNKSGQLKKIPPRIIFNWESNDHLKLLFFSVLKDPITKKTLKGNASVDSSFLETLKPKYPWVETLLEHKDLKKITNTYLAGLLEKQEGGIIHAHFNLAGTATGRFSSSNPNLQNLPKHGGVKSLFVPRPGYKFIYADYSQLELRIAAHLSNDKTLIEAYKNNLDLHQQTADLIGSTRDQAKTINFAIIYNASGWRVAEIMGWMDGLPLCTSTERDYKCKCVGCVERRSAMKKGDALIEKLNGKYIGLKKYIDSYRDFMLRYKITISEFGKMRRLDGLNSQNKKEYNHAIKAGFNLPIQSFGASLCKRSMVALHNMGYNIVNQIHDSIMVEVPQDRLSDALVDIKSCMEGVFSLRVPLVVEPKILTSFEEK